jgi:flavin reductase (DIM6/NTAB) family NADH-FMN oxidoreductase RutF
LPDKSVNSFAKAKASSAMDVPAALPADRAVFRYAWPGPGAMARPPWQFDDDLGRVVRPMPETRAELASDSRWPVFFPSPICLVTTRHDGIAHLEKVVGASIVNRFPYVVALSFCREGLSPRHYVRRTFMEAMEASGRVAVQFLMPGDELARVMAAIAGVPEEEAERRFAVAGTATRQALNSDAPVFEPAYLIYECRLVKPCRDFDGMPIYPSPWTDCGSHRIYYLEIETISLREEIASGPRALWWRSLPVWRDGPAAMRHSRTNDRRQETLSRTGFVKNYSPDYVFPGPGTIAFAADEHRDGFAIKHLPTVGSRIEIDNDQSRWPCFFPSSLGMITVEDRDGTLGGLACGSTTVISRHPIAVAICVSYARINERYAPRASLDLLHRADRFGCGVPIYRADVLDAITYLGNVSRRLDADKVASCGLTVRRLGATIGFDELPAHYGCRIVERIRLGTHLMIIGEVEELLVRPELAPDRPLEWCPWAGQLPP